MSNNSPLIDDFRSDTITRPTAAMRQTIAEAEVGDDVFGDDPNVNQLESKIAAMLGKESALFVPSGTMSNLIALRLHGRPGDEFLCEANCHVLRYEQGGYAQVNQLCTQAIPGEHGHVLPERFEGLIRPENIHMVRTRFLVIENTHNYAGGIVLPYDDIERTCRWAHDNGLTTHLDGARLFNAVVRSGITAPTWSQHFDTVSICFSKGLGAPVGSALVGPADWIDQARRHRKLLGGGMRQAGLLAAAASYALDHHIQRLAEDHANAERLADAIRAARGLCLSPDMKEICPDTPIGTNMVFFEVESPDDNAESFCSRLKEQGVLMLPLGPRRIRAVTHLDVNADAVNRAIAAIRQVLSE